MCVWMVLNVRLLGMSVSECGYKVGFSHQRCWLKSLCAFPASAAITNEARKGHNPFLPTLLV